MTSRDAKKSEGDGASASLPRPPSDGGSGTVDAEPSAEPSNDVPESPPGGASRWDRFRRTLLAPALLAPSLLTAGGLYLTGPRINLWGLAFVAWLPLLIAATPTVDGGRRRLWPVYVGGLVYWVSVLAGLRHAHPLMFLPALAMAAYLAIFFVIIVWAIRRGVAAGWPLAIVFPWAVLTTELFRNYFATGISVAMLSHAVTSATWLIQPARIGGAYLVSVLIAFVTGSLADLYRRRGPSRRRWPSAAR